MAIVALFMHLLTQFIRNTLIHSFLQNKIENNMKLRYTLVKFEISFQ